MTPAMLAPPQPSAAPPSPVEDAPRLPVRVPLSGGGRQRVPMVSRRALAGSVAAHLLLAVALVLAPRRMVERTAAGSPDARGGGETVSYLDMNDFPGMGGSAAPAAAAPSGAAAMGEAFPDSAVSSAPATSAAPRTTAPGRPEPGLSFPTRTPGAIPGGATAAGGRPGGAPAGAGGAGQAGAPGVGSTAGGRLQPGYRDPRLHAPRELPQEPPLTDLQKYRERLDARIGRLNDSIAAEGQRSRDSRDWTFQDKNGRRWGFDENGRAVIAGRTIPIPISLPPGDPDHAAAGRARARQRGEIDRQVDRIERERHFRERTEAVRARQDSIRNARKPGGQ